MPPERERLVRGHLVRPVRVQVGPASRPVDKVSQVLYPLHRDEKTPLLLSLLRGGRGKGLVFTRTQHRADRLGGGRRGGAARGGGVAPPPGARPGPLKSRLTRLPEPGYVFFGFESSVRVRQPVRDKESLGLRV